MRLFASPKGFTILGFIINFTGTLTIIYHRTSWVSRFSGYNRRHENLAHIRENIPDIDDINPMDKGFDNITNLVEK